MIIGMNGMENRETAASFAEGPGLEDRAPDPNQEEKEILDEPELDPTSQDLVGAFTAECTTLTKKLDELSASVAAQGQQITELVARDQLIGRLHDRLAQFEQAERDGNFTEPLTRKIAALHRRVMEQRTLLAGALRKVPEPLRRHSTKAWSLQSLDGVRIELETILGDFGVEVFTCEGDRFDRARQSAVQRMATNDTAQVGRIASRLAPGFQVGERVIVAERVSVFVKSENS